MCGIIGKTAKKVVSEIIERIGMLYMVMTQAHNMNYGLVFIYIVSSILILRNQRSHLGLCLRNKVPIIF